jgi:hypothetical protein
VRILVVGRYPPPLSLSARETMAAVRDAAASNDVEVLSTPGSAAHHRGRLTGPGGAMDAWRRSRGFDAVVVLVTADTPLRLTAGGRRGRLSRLADCFAWGLALRAMRSTTLVVPDPDVIPGSIGGRTGRFLWSGARKIVVGSDYAGDRLVTDGGCDPARVEVRQRAQPAVARWDAGWEGAIDQPSVEELIKQRAADARRGAVRGGQLS